MKGCVNLLLDCVHCHLVEARVLQCWSDILRAVRSFLHNADVEALCRCCTGSCERQAHDIIYDLTQHMWIVQSSSINRTLYCTVYTVPYKAKSYN